MALMSPCLGCGRLVPYGASRCEECARKLGERSAESSRERERARRKAREADADPKYRAFYRSKEWRALSASVLSRASFVCEDCGGLACEVHHEPSIKTEGGWDRRLDAGCLHPLCTRCHNARHARFGKPRGAVEKVSPPHLGNGQGACGAQKSRNTI